MNGNVHQSSTFTAPAGPVLSNGPMKGRLPMENGGRDGEWGGAVRSGEAMRTAEQVSPSQAPPLRTRAATTLTACISHDIHRSKRTVPSPGSH